MFVGSILLLPVLASCFRIVPTGIVRAPDCLNGRHPHQRFPYGCSSMLLKLAPPKILLGSSTSFRLPLPLRHKFLLATASTAEPLDFLKPEEVKVLLDEVFKKDVVDVGVLRDASHFNDPEVCVIPEPEITMRGKCFGDLDRIVGTVVDATREGPDYRHKPFVGLMKGNGGGKTRLVEEVRRRLLSTHSNILPVAITFNSKWTFPHNMEKEVWKCIDNVRGLSATTKLYAKLSMSIVLRVLSMVYRQDTSTIGQRLKASRRFLAMLSRMNVCSYESVLKGLVMHVVGKAKESCPQIDSFVLLMDETAKICDYFDGNTAESDDDAAEFDPETFFRRLRDALLANGIWLDNNRVNIGLLISTVSIWPIYTGISWCAMHLLKPRDPEVDEVVKDWWGLGWIDKLKDHRPVMDMYRVLASVFRRWMRASEFVLRILEERCRNAFQLSLQQVGESLDSKEWKDQFGDKVREMLVNASRDMIDEDLFQKLAVGRQTPSDLHVFDMVFHQRGPLAPDRVFLIKDSFISDAVRDYFTDDVSVGVDSFNVSLFALYLSAKHRDTNSSGFSVANDFIRLVQDVNELKNGMNGNMDTMRPLLEEFDQSYLLFRLRTATAAGKSEITLNELLCCYCGKLGPIKLLQGHENKAVHRMSTLNSSYDPSSATAVAQELMDIEVNEKCPYKVIFPQKNEAWHYAVKYYDTKDSSSGSGSSRLLFCLNKMLSPHNNKEDCQQHQHMSRVMAAVNGKYTKENCAFIYLSPESTGSDAFDYDMEAMMLGTILDSEDVQKYYDMFYEAIEMCAKNSREALGDIGC